MRKKEKKMPPCANVMYGCDRLAASKVRGLCGVCSNNMNGWIAKGLTKIMQRKRQLGLWSHRMDTVSGGGRRRR